MGSEYQGERTVSSSHLQFADDAIFFLGATIKIALALKKSPHLV